MDDLVQLPPWAALLIMAILGALVWIRHVFTRDWNENQDRLRRESGSISNHRKFAIEYHRRRIVTAVAGFRATVSHYSFEQNLPICGSHASTDHVVVPLTRWTTCPDCHRVLDGVLADVHGALSAPIRDTPTS